MANQQIQEKIKALRRELNYYNGRYYNSHVSEIYDDEFDQKMKELQQLEEKFPEFNDPNSPTKRVGGDITKEFTTLQHKYPMLSLNNTYSKEELEDFMKRIAKLIPGEIEYVCELKYDGTAIGITYKNGKLIRAVTRGDGTQGDDVTINAKTIKTIPLQLQDNDYPEEFEIRAEIFIPLEGFNKLNQKRVKSNREKLQDNDYPEEFEIRAVMLLEGFNKLNQKTEMFMLPERFNKLNREIVKLNREIVKLNRERGGKLKKLKELFANPRNTVSGTLKMQDSSIVASRPLDCFLCSVLSDDYLFDNHYENMLRAQKWGFKIPLPERNYISKAKSIGEIFDFINHWEEHRHKLPFQIDGAVIKVNNYINQNRLGATTKSPRWAIAYKYKAERTSTRLNSIKYQVGRTGAITPVADLEPIQLAGTTIKRASLHNKDQIEKLDLHVGDYVFVEKGGEIIPKLIDIDLNKRKANAEPINYITHCPECGSKLIRKPVEALHYCPNDTDCPSQIKGRIQHFISRKAMDIKGMESKVVELFVNEGLISNYADLYDLRKEQLLSFKKFLLSLGIPSVGEERAKRLACHFETTKAVMNASEEELANVDKIVQRIAENIRHFFGRRENPRLMERLVVERLKSKVLQSGRVDEISAQNIIDGIKASKRVPFEKVLFALGIRYVGETAAKRLAYHFETIEALTKASEEELTNVDEIGQRIAESVRHFFGRRENLQLVERLKSKGLQFRSIKKKVTFNALRGMTIVISGSFERYSRTEIKGLIEKHGGKNASSVSNRTDLIVSGEVMGPSKRRKAEDLGIRIIDENEFATMIN